MDKLGGGKNYLMISRVSASQEAELYLIELPLKRQGFRKFIGTWLLRARKQWLLVDPGPSVGLPLLLTALRELGVRRLDYILLTHIHLDHAGAVGGLLEYFSDCLVFTHPKARKHLENPTRLWKGSVRVLSKMAYFYGPIQPVPHGKFVEQVPDSIMRVIETPGHASHHVSFLWRNFLFTGEAAGVYLKVGDTFYLRPATPHRFSFDSAVLSLETLLRLMDDETTICFGHFGWAPRAKAILELARQQLYRWESIIVSSWRRLRGQAEKDWLSLLADELLHLDPLLKVFEQLEPDIQVRERYFLENSVKGYLGYLYPSLLDCDILGLG